RECRRSRGGCSAGRQGPSGSVILDTEAPARQPEHDGDEGEGDGKALAPGDIDWIEFLAAELIGGNQLTLQNASIQDAQVARPRQDEVNGPDDLGEAPLGLRFLMLLFCYCLFNLFLDVEELVGRPDNEQNEPDPEGQQDRRNRALRQDAEQDGDGV